MKKLLLTTLLMMFALAAAAHAERFADFTAYEGVINNDGTFTYTDVPVNNFGAYGFLCADPNCNDASGQLYGGSNVASGSDNVVRVTYPTNLQSPFGYAHIFHKEDYVTWVQTADFFGTSSSDPQEANVFLAKVEQCRAPIDSFVVVNDAAPNEPIMFDVQASLDATVYSAINFGGPVGFQAPQIPQNYEVETLVTLEIKDQNSNVVNTQQQLATVDFSGQLRIFFEYTPDQVGRYTATVTTTVPDGKCLDDEPAFSAKQFSVIGETAELCYALANNLQVSPLHQVAGKPTTISVETLANAYDEFGNLDTIPYDVIYRVRKGSYDDEFVRSLGNNPNIDDYKQLTESYTFPEEGEYIVSVRVDPQSCPYDDSTFDVVQVEYEVKPGQDTNPNSAPILIIPDVFLDENEGFVNNIFNIEQYASDADQAPDTLAYQLSDQTNTNIVDCSLDSFNNLDCVTKKDEAGVSILTFTATDDAGAVATDFVSVTVTAVPQCNDGIDNDGDGLTDLADPGCRNAYDDDESDDPVIPECRDGIDNDNDGLTDLHDPGCSSPDDNDESDGTTQCQDGVDNDNDNLIDLDDPGCENRFDDDEYNDPIVNKICYDSDNGKNIFVLGQTRIETNGVITEQQQDYCKDSNTLVEYICTMYGIDSHDITCAYGCQSGTCRDAPLPQCKDGIDNDGDGLTDLADPGCANPDDNDESDDPFIAQCADGIDNDGDGLTDLADPGCSNPDDNDESDDPFIAQCADGIDNDGDGKIDLLDPGCMDKNDNDESDDPVQTKICTDSDLGNMPFTKGTTKLFVDDVLTQQEGDYCRDANTLVEFFCTMYGIDSQDTNCAYGCSNGACNTAPIPQCKDGLDNDGDGLTDLADPGCSSPDDNDESDDPFIPQCADGIDNDGDGLTDLADPGCANVNDNDESDDPIVTQCNDGVDNDGDGFVDLNDAGCSSPTDDSENGQLFCTDTDSGNTPFTQGTLQLFEETTLLMTATDFCQDANTLVEYVCSDNVRVINGQAQNVAVGISCAYGCSNGACQVKQDTPQTCEDGLDNDGDGLIDLDDPGCSSPKDNDESNDNDDAFDQSVLMITNIYADDPQDFFDGYDGTISMWLNNAGDTDLDNVRVQVFILETGDKASAGPFDLRDGERQRVSMYMPVMHPIEPGWYTLRISLWSDGVQRIKHREILLE